MICALRKGHLDRSSLHDELRRRRGQKLSPT